MNEHIDPRDLEHFSEPDKVDLITEQSHPKLFALFSEAADVLGTTLPNKLYLDNSAKAKMGKLYAKSRNISVSKTAISIFPANELKAIIGHEMEHKEEFEPLRRLLRIGITGLPAIAIAGIGVLCEASGLAVAAVAVLAVTSSLATDFLIMYQSEYNADKAGAKAASPDAMVNAIKIIEAHKVKTELEKGIEQLPPHHKQKGEEAYGPEGLSLDDYKNLIFEKKFDFGSIYQVQLSSEARTEKLLDCHPPYEKRIQRLKNMEPQSHVERLESESAQIDNSPAIPQASA